MEVKPMISVNEIEQSIIIPNPIGRWCIVRKWSSGFKENQIFTSDNFPDEIEGKFIGLARTLSRKVYPTYVLEVPIARKYLILRGRVGYVNSIRIMNTICRKLISQKGILSVRNIKKEDLEAFDFRKEELYYLLASHTTEIKMNYGAKYKYYYNSEAIGGKVDERLILKTPCGIKKLTRAERKYSSFGKIRPIVTLKTRVFGVYDESEYNWIEL